METIFTIAGVLFSICLVYALAKGQGRLAVALAIIGTAVWFLYYS